MGRQLAGTVEADDLYHTAGNKGQAKGGGKKSLGRRARGRRKKREPGRGHDDKDRPAIIAWVSRQGSVVIQVTRDFTVKTVQKAADIAVGIVSKGVREPVERLTLFRSTFSPDILSKAKHYKYIELFRSNKWAPKSINLLSRSVRQSLAVQAGSRLYTDSASSYRALKGYVHEFVNHTLLV